MEETENGGRSRDSSVQKLKKSSAHKHTRMCICTLYMCICCESAFDVQRKWKLVNVIHSLWVCKSVCFCGCEKLHIERMRVRRMQRKASTSTSNRVSTKMRVAISALCAIIPQFTFHIVRKILSHDYITVDCIIMIDRTCAQRTLIRPTKRINCFPFTLNSAFEK